MRVYIVQICVHAYNDHLDSRIQSYIHIYTPYTVIHMCMMLLRCVVLLLKCMNSSPDKSNPLMTCRCACMCSRGCVASVTLICVTSPAQKPLDGVQM